MGKKREKKGHYGPKRVVLSSAELQGMADELSVLAGQISDWAGALADLGVSTELSRGNFDNASRRLRVWVIQQVERNVKLSAEKAGKALRKSEGR
jgi:hypothetical protein